MKHLLIVNGLEAPLLRQFGCDCPRCNDPTPQANTSVSLVSLNGAGETAHHVLFDVGTAVTDNLFRSPYLVGRRARLDWLVLTHWHPDHVNDLNRLLVSYHLNRIRRDEEPTPVPLWCRRSAAGWLQRDHSYEWHEFLEPHTSDENHPPGTVLPPLPIDLPGVAITPVTVSHYGADRCVQDRQKTCYSCAAYVVETSTVKTVLLWDIDNENEWIVNPQTEAQETAVRVISNADHLFIDTSFWHSKDKPTTHPGFANVQRYARALTPRETLLVHLSGHPDGRGNPGWGWTNARWEQEAQKVWMEKQLPGRVRVPAIGEEFVLGNGRL
ncbi:MAG: MBL fold metallo-hydrolase [Chloroflexi bacterium]|nr:MBL fold metallo-hydrolase [Chloroflexota bacterium]